MNLNKELKKLDKCFKKYLKEEFTADSIITIFSVSFVPDENVTRYDIDFAFSVIRDQKHIKTVSVPFFVKEKEIRDRHFMLGQLSAILLHSED